MAFHVFLSYTFIISMTRAWMSDYKVPKWLQKITVLNQHNIRPEITKGLPWCSWVWATITICLASVLWLTFLSQNLLKKLNCTWKSGCPNSHEKSHLATLDSHSLHTHSKQKLLPPLCGPMCSRALHSLLQWFLTQGKVSVVTFNMLTLLFCSLKHFLYGHSLLKIG
jgi:hypothetical protein